MTTPPPGYREFQGGEIIRADDLYLSGSTWKPAVDFVGIRYVKWKWFTPPVRKSEVVTQKPCTPEAKP